MTQDEIEARADEIVLGTLMRTSGTGSYHFQRETVRGVTLLLAWLLDTKPRDVAPECDLSTTFRCIKEAM